LIGLIGLVYPIQDLATNPNDCRQKPFNLLRCQMLLMPGNRLY